METLVPDLLWTDYHALRVLGFPLGRRVTVARNTDGRLVVFSPLRASAEAISELKSLGTIAAFVVQNHYHDLFYEDYFEAFPDAVFLAASDNRQLHASWPLRDFSERPELLAGFRHLVLEGMPRVQEQLFLHEATRTLIIADAFFNLPEGEGFLERLWLRIGDMGGKPRPSRLFRSAIQSPEAFVGSLARVLSWDFDRIVGGHGLVVPSDGKRVLWNAYDFLLKP